MAWLLLPFAPADPAFTCPALSVPADAWAWGDGAVSTPTSVYEAIAEVAWAAFDLHGGCPVTYLTEESEIVTGDCTTAAGTSIQVYRTSDFYGSHETWDLHMVFADGDTLTFTGEMVRDSDERAGYEHSEVTLDAAWTGDPIPGLPADENVAGADRWSDSGGRHYATTRL
jgi:hypothetical protein